MIQEYLFINDTHRAAVENYAPSKIEVDIYNIENSDCWIVTYSLPGENEDCAKSLSYVNKYVLDHFNPTVLTNESSAYFNRKLYPYVNEFERKLRKLLYLKSAIYNGEKKVDNIRDLESKDLGVIFELLFTDAEFVKSAKTKVNEKTWQFTKKEIIATLQSIAEDTMWNNLLGKEAVPLLSDNFVTVKNYRNDVMHAHDIDVKIFREAKKLFIDINKQLDTQIGLIIKKAEENPEETADSEFNDALNTALVAQNISGAVQQIRDSVVELTGGQPEAIREFIQNMQEYYSSINYPQIQDAIKPILELYSGEEYAQLQKTLREVEAYQRSPEFTAMQQQMRNFATFSTKLKESLGLIYTQDPEKKTLPQETISPESGEEKTEIDTNDDV